eukprot:NODE_50_length_31184_cov_0.705099.p9 type:complete len:365 gc:universal NODE_50_length_31184_cov_0.705099:4712-5806(+)
MNIKTWQFYRAPTKNPVKKHRDTWMVFDKQQDALEYYYKSSQNVHVFSREQSQSGKRQFIVDTIENFYQTYIELDEKHFYELIPIASPCHLYFDLEFYTKYNMELNGNELLELFIQQLKLFINLQIHREVKDIVVLDSSRDEKYSKHLLIHLENAIFKSNWDCLNLVNNFLSDCELVGKSFKVNIENDVSNFCDLSVYSKNRQFRLFLSSKFGGNTILSIDNEALSVETFKKTLITYCPSRIYNDIIEIQPKYLSIPKRKILKSDNNFDFEEGSSCASLDTYMRSKLPGTINKILRKPNSIIFSIVGNRFCERIGREHKSNGVYYVVNVKNGNYYQACHDPDCRGFVGKPHELPTEIYFDLFEV